MTIDLDVRATAKRFGLDPALLQAVVQAEGDILKAVRCSLPNTPDRAAALDITCRSAVHALCDYVKGDASGRQSFVDFFAARWAPVGAANDPKGLNANWSSNQTRLWMSA